MLGKIFPQYVPVLANPDCVLHRFQRPAVDADLAVQHLGEGDVLPHDIPLAPVGYHVDFDLEIGLLPAEKLLRERDHALIDLFIAGVDDVQLRAGEIDTPRPVDADVPVLDVFPVGLGEVEEGPGKDVQRPGCLRLDKDDQPVLHQEAEIVVDAVHKDVLYGDYFQHILGDPALLRVESLKELQQVLFIPEKMSKDAVFHPVAKALPVLLADPVQRYHLPEILLSWLTIS